MTVFFELCPLPMLVVSHDGHVARSNSAWQSFWETVGTGPSPENIGQEPLLGQLGIVAALHRAAQGERVYLTPQRFTLGLSGVSDKPRWIQLSFLPLPGESGGVSSIAVMLIDSTAQKLAEEELAHSTFHDVVTGLPNRASFVETLEREVAQGKRREEITFAVALVDLDRFKVVNEGLGHEVGDRLLAEVASRLARCIRPGDLVARIGGDEFAVLLFDLVCADLPDCATRIISRMHGELDEPIRVSGRDIFVAASTGIAFPAGETISADDLLRDADTALARAKERGRNRYEIFDDLMHTKAVERLALETDLRRALDQNDLTVVYQPIVDLNSGRVMGFEALVRWRHAVRGVVPPCDFIPVAEEMGLIDTLGRQVLAKAAKWAATFSRGSSWDAPFTPFVSVNLSPRQFSQSDLVEQIQEVLRSSNLDPSRLKLEITEGVVMEDVHYAAHVLARLRALGIGLLIDDFGTGHSSLAYLSRFPIDTLKIDRSFVAAMLGSVGDAEIIRAVLALAGALGLSVVAEGVERVEQAHALRELGCRRGQGYFYSEPLPPEAAARFGSNRIPM